MPKILIVEDEAPNAEILNRLLVMNKFDVLIAGNKKDAIEILKAVLTTTILRYGQPRATTVVGDAFRSTTRSRVRTEVPYGR